MTIPEERYRSLFFAKEFMRDLIYKKGRWTKKELRERAIAVLRHYPFDFEIEDMAKKSPKLLKKEKVCTTF